MAFLQNAWYCVGFPEDFVAGSLKPLKVLGRPLVLMRRTDGAVVALDDRCPHRFAPLSLGKVEDDQVQCPYHGLRFDASGRCVFNPHGDGAIPRAARVRAFPVLERHGIVWVWMGDADRADPALVPDFKDIEERPGWTRVNGYLLSPANYELIVDNLLDLSHVRYLHPFLSGVEGQRKEPERIDNRLEQNGDSIVAVMHTFRDDVPPVAQLLWDNGPLPEVVDAWADMRWTAPCVMLLDAGFTPAGRARNDGVSFPSAHLLTPETETTTHYFFVSARNTHPGQAAISQTLLQAAMAAFGGEDSPMIQACERNMGGSDLMSLNPVLLQTDASALRARRLLSARLREEAAATAPRVGAQHALLGP